MPEEPTAQRWRRSVIVATVAAIVALCAGAWWGLAGRDRNDGADSATATSSPPPAAPTTAPYIAPLTGLPSGTGDVPRALVVKIDAAPQVSRFIGVADADLVYEVLVEGGITRYLAIFQSQEPPVVGPVRSIRTSDFDLVANLGMPIVVYSGADELTGRSAGSAPLIPFTPDSSGGKAAFHRDRSLRAPHNLFVSPEEVRAAIGDPGVVRAPFSHLLAGDPVPAARPLDTLRIRFSSSRVVTVTWDEDRGEWVREVDRRRQVDENGTQLGTSNVLVLFIGYSHPPWDRNAPQAESVGRGFGQLLTHGSVIPLSWSRPTAEDPFILTAADDTPLALPPGRTWVAFAPPVGSD